MSKPVLFLDFDRTLFDTVRLYEWLGGKAESAIFTEKEKEPNLASMLYPDALSFLKSARRIYRLVLLTSTTDTSVQNKKVRGSGVLPYLDDVIMVGGVMGGYLGKGAAIKEYVSKINAALHGNVFVDDLPEFISEAKKINPQVRCVRIDRPRLDKLISPEGLLPPDDVISTLSELLILLRIEPPLEE